MNLIDIVNAIAEGGGFRIAGIVNSLIKEKLQRNELVIKLLTSVIIYIG
jgi:hypothetical protein